MAIGITGRKGKARSWARNEEDIENEDGDAVDGGVDAVDAVDVAAMCGAGDAMPWVLVADEARAGRDNF